MADEEVMKEIDKVDGRLARLEVTVATEFQKIGQSFREVHKHFDDVHKRFDQVDSRFDRLEAAFKTQDDRISEGFRDIADRIDKPAPRRIRRGKRQ